MAFVAVWERRVDGLARTLADDETHELAVEWGSPGGGSGPLGDGSQFSGYELATSHTSAIGLGRDRNMLAAALDLGEDPQDQSPVVGDPAPSGYEATGAWGLRVSTVIASGAYQFPPELADAGYTLTIGFATLDPDGSSVFAGVDFPLTTGTNSGIDELISAGIVDAVEGLPFGAVTSDDVADVNAGIKVPFLSLDGPYSARDPLLLVADIVLTIAVGDGPIPRSVIRRFPRDDARGLGSGTRIFPPPRAGRIVGGFQ